jgi:uncharacterized membrane protein YphA (DoxX/SURF4 family)
MSTQAPIEQAQLRAHNPHWSLPKRLAFRFFFAYLGLYCLTTQILAGLHLPTFSKHAVPILGTLWPLRQITFWTAAHIFRISQPLVYMSGTGDKTFDWVQAFCLFVLAALGTVVWSFLNKRGNYVFLDGWFRLFLRLALASEMFLYGLAKIIPNQMPFPFLTRWVEPFGNFTPMGVLWNSVGASPAYEIFTGCAETLGGILLLIPRTTLLGAIICLAYLAEIFAMNMAYDVSRKLLSFHLILIALFLLAPELPRLADFFLNREVGPSSQPELFRSGRASRIMADLQIIACIYLLGIYAYGNAAAWYAYGGGRQKSSFYGIWTVNEISIDGHLRPPLLTDQDRWRRVIFDFPASVTFQGMDDSFAGYGATISSQGKTITLTKESDKDWKANFVYDQTAPSLLTLDGTMDGHAIHMKLERIETDKFPLANRKFHWIADYPFDRQEVRR